MDMYEVSANFFFIFPYSYYNVLTDWDICNIGIYLFFHQSWALGGGGSIYIYISLFFAIFVLGG